jgi:superfamily II DNA/RNA helicase
LTAPSFGDLGVCNAVVEALAARAITEPFPIQALVMGDGLAGRDVLAKSQTGSGKTLAFALPIVERVDASAPSPAALILVPTRELATQVRDEFRDIARAKNLRAAAVFGGTRVREQGRQARGAGILIATPGRLDDLANRKLIDLGKVSVLVLDEADRMLDMGFAPQVDRIVKRLPKQRQTMFFSATLEGLVGHLARKYTHDAAEHEVVATTRTVEEANHRFVPVTLETKFAALQKILREETGITLVFVNTKVAADRLYAKLQGAGIESLTMHGNMSQPARKSALERFSSGKVRTLIATDVAARGIDIDDIAQVVNYDAPESYKTYLHRVGRTARAGKTGTGVTLVMPLERGDISVIASQLGLSEEFEAEGMKLLQPRRLYSSSRGRRSPNAMRRRRVGRRP